jgi:hypothetical protein
VDAKDKSIRNEKSDLAVGVCLSAYVTLIGVSGGLLLVSLYAMVTLHPSFWQFSVMWFLVSVVAFVWLRSFEVRLTEIGVSISTLFSRANSLRWSDIEQSNVRIGYKAKDGLSESFKPPFRLVLVPRGSASGKQITINLKLLSRDDVTQVIERLASELGTLEEHS